MGFEEELFNEQISELSFKSQTDISRSSPPVIAIIQKLMNIY
jgi:hypothetical protein